MISLQQTLQHKREFPRSNAIRNTFLVCGVISTLWYFFINIYVPLHYPGYTIQSQTVSELSAIDAPTKGLWIALCIPYTVLLIAFGCGVWLVSKGNWKLRLVGVVLIFDAIFGGFWPPMHQREVIAAGNGTLTDNLHIVWAYVHLCLILLAIGFAAASVGRKFRLYSIFTVVLFLVFGALTTVEAPGIAKNEPTPYIGIWERINMAAYMIWISVLGFVLLKQNKQFVKNNIRNEHVF